MKREDVSRSPVTFHVFTFHVFTFHVFTRHAIIGRPVTGAPIDTNRPTRPPCRTAQTGATCARRPTLPMISRNSLMERLSAILIAKQAREHRKAGQQQHGR